MPYTDPKKRQEAAQRYYRENKTRLYAAKNSKRNMWRRRIQEIKGNTPCKDCGESFPHYVMDFDHLPGTEKKFTIAQTSSVTSTEALEAEIAKCDIVCANCHRHRTFMRNSERSS